MGQQNRILKKWTTQQQQQKPTEENRKSNISVRKHQNNGWQQHGLHETPEHIVRWKNKAKQKNEKKG